MLARLKVTISHLKTASKQRTISRRNLQAQLKARDNKIVHLNAELKRLRAFTKPEKVFNHVYPVQMMILAVFMVVHGGSSLRCAAATVEFYADMMGWKFNRPSPATVRTWVIRCGYHALNYGQHTKGDYVMIIDESIQIGKEKLLLMLGVKIDEQSCYCAPLNGQDVEVLGMEVQSSWTGSLIAEFIERTMATHPSVNIVHVISDRGTTILAALRRLNLLWVSDCTHEMMNTVKGIFKDDNDLNELIASIGQLRRRLTLTSWAGLLPPTLRDKDRFLRVFTIVEWAKRMDTYWKKLPPIARKHIAFYRKAWPVMRRLRQVRELIVITSDILKTAGLNEHSYRRWQQKTDQYLATQKIVTTQAQTFIHKMKTYFTTHAQLYEGRSQLLCCSDIIESTFGRYKNKGGMKAISADVLSIALYNRKMTTQFIQSAMTTVSCKTIKEWEQQNVCLNRYALRRRMDQELKSVG